jgi:hypothetical protein
MKKVTMTVYVDDAQANSMLENHLRNSMPIETEAYEMRIAIEPVEEKEAYQILKDYEDLMGGLDEIERTEI